MPLPKKTDEEIVNLFIDWLSNGRPHGREGSKYCFYTDTSMTRAVRINYWQLVRDVKYMYGKATNKENLIFLFGHYVWKSEIGYYFIKGFTDK